MSDIESNPPKQMDASALLGSLLSNPDLIRNISSMIGKPGEGAIEKPAAQSIPSQPIATNNDAVTAGISRVLSNPEMMAKLPDVMKMLAPMMQGPQSLPRESSPTSASLQSGAKDRHGCRNDLLIALKPFLSPERCHAIDMLLGLSRLGDVLQKMI